MSTKLRKPLMIALLTVLLCALVSATAVISFGFAEEATTPEQGTEAEQPLIVLPGEQCFVIDETGKVTGLSEEGIAALSEDKSYELVIPANVVSFGNAYFRNYKNIVKVSFAENSQCTSLALGRSGAFANIESLRIADLTNATALQKIDRAFSGCTSLETVIMPPSLKDNATMPIGTYAFYGTAITSFTIYDYIISITSNAFGNCTKLESVILDENNTYFTRHINPENGQPYDQAVYTKRENGEPNLFVMAPYSMEKITLPLSMLTDNVYDLDLDNIGGLQTIDIVENENIYAYGNALYIKEGSGIIDGEYYFANDAVLIPKGIVEFGIPKDFAYEWGDNNSWLWSLFQVNTYPKMQRIFVQEGNTAYKSLNGVLYNSDCSKYFVPDGMEQFILPVQLETFDFTTLSNKSTIKSVVVEEEHPTYSSVGGVVYNKEVNEIIFVPKGIENFVIPKQIEKFDFTFIEKYQTIKTVAPEEGHPTYTMLDDGVIYVNDLTEVCYIPDSIEHYVIPKQVTNLDFSVLAAKKTIKSVTVEEEHPTYTMLDDGIIYDKGLTVAYYATKELTEYYAPSTLKEIGQMVFGSKDHPNTVKKVYVEDVEKWAQIKFGDTIETPEQYEATPDGSSSYDKRSATAVGLSNKYGPNPMSGGAQMYVKDGERWTLLENLVLDFDGPISDQAFAGCASLISVSVSNRVTRVGEFAFAGCKNIRNMTLPFVGVKQECTIKTPEYSAYFAEIFCGRGSHQAGAFTFAVGGLSPVEMESLTVTGYNVIHDTYGAGRTLYGIPHGAFTDAPVNKITISIDQTDGHVIEAQYGIFFNSQVKSVDLVNSQISVSDNSLFVRTNVEEVALPATLKNIPDSLFYSATALKKVIIPEGVETLGMLLFSNTENIHSVTLPASIIKMYSLGTNSQLKTVYLKGFAGDNSGVTYIKDSEVYVNYIATDAEVYSKLPENMKNISGLNSSEFASVVFYIAEVEFQLKDSAGNVIATTTEKHLAAQDSGSKAYLKFGAVQSDGGEYWALNDGYALPDVIGQYKADNTKWTLNDVAVTTDTCLVGEQAKYVMTQTLDDATTQLVPMDVQKEYDGKEWVPYEGIEISGIDCTDGGNGYYWLYKYSPNPKDVGRYVVKAKCKDGYAWADAAENASAERTFTITITPVEATLEWYYEFESGAQHITDGAIPERVYNGYSTRENMYAIFTDINGVERTVNSSAFYLFAAGDRETSVQLKNVGLYDFVLRQTVSTVDEGEWLGNYTFTNPVQQFRITPYKIDLSDVKNLTWGIDGYNSDLLDYDLYIYNGVPYAHEQTDKGDVIMRSVVSSVARDREVEGGLKIIISNIPNVLSGAGGMYTAEYLNNVATHGVGIYTTQAVLKVADGNYEFEYGLGMDLLSRGISIIINPDGSATIQKEWYVVAMDNGMRNPNGDYYVINGWVFGAGTAIKAPRLEHGDENAEEYLTNKNVSFTLKRNGEVIAENFLRSAFERYLNPSMPAGSYELTCVIKNVTLGNHTHWWDNEEHNDSGDKDIIYHGFTREIRFTVANANLAFTLTAGADGYGAYEWQYDVNKKAEFFNKFHGAADCLLKDKVGMTSVTPTGYWAEHAEYYGNDYAVTYNFARMNTDRYYALNNTDLLNEIAVGTNATYKVYFEIAAPNHNSLTTQGESRYAYFFTVTVYETVATPTFDVGGLVYTGSKVQPVIAEDSRYQIVWDAEDAYIAGGLHSVAFKLYDAVHYRWADSQTDTVNASFTIAKADNAWTRVPNVVSWTYNTFDAQINRIYAVVKFLDSGERIRFAVTKADGTAIAALADVAVNADGTVNGQTLITALNTLAVGGYKLVVTVNGTDNYKELSQSVEFNVGKATNQWAITPNVMQWKYNGYDRAVNLILGEARISDASNPVVFKVTSDEAGENEIIANFSLVEGLVPEQVAAKLAALSVGDYYLWASVAETESYSKLQPDEALKFAVSKAVNDWKQSLDIINWSYGSFDKNTNRILGSVMYGSVTYSLTKNGTAVAGLESFTSVTDAIAGILAKLDVGSYTLRATVSVDANHEAISEQSVNLTISKANNTWADGENDLVLPSWIVGKFSLEENIIAVKAAHGEALIQIRDLDGNIYYDSTKPEENTLNSLEEGKYLLAAWVEGSANFEALPERTFTIEVLPKIGLPWWGTTLVAVGALGLAAAILLILWKLKVFEILTDKISLAITTRATVDATIAAVRATKKAEEAEAHKRKVEARERLEAAREAHRNKSPEQRAQELSEKAEVTATRADKLQKRASKMRERADRLASKNAPVDEPETQADELDAETDAPDVEPVDVAHDTSEE